MGYQCSACGEKFAFPGYAAIYYFHGEAALPACRLNSSELSTLNARPGWCKDCEALCLVEDIQPLRKFEDAYGAVRSGRTVEYPVETQNLSPEEALQSVEAHLRWRMNRRRPPRALCCGRTNFQLLDVPQPLLKHAECDFGVVEPRHFHIGAYNGPGPGVISPANIRVYSGEGELIGLLTWRDRGSDDVWEVVPCAYPAVVDEE